MAQKMHLSSREIPSFNIQFQTTYFRTHLRLQQTCTLFVGQTRDVLQQQGHANGRRTLQKVYSGSLFFTVLCVHLAKSSTQMSKKEACWYHMLAPVNPRYMAGEVIVRKVHVGSAYLFLRSARYGNHITHNINITRTANKHPLP